MQHSAPNANHEDRLFRYALAFGILMALVCLGYFEENWRGRHNWNKLKQRLEANGGHVDWTNYILAPVPEDQNFFGVPQMRQWFVGRGGNDLTGRLGLARDAFMHETGSEAVAEVTVVQSGQKVADGEADIILDYDPVLSTLALPSQVKPEAGDHAGEVIPLIVMDEVPLGDAIKALARQDGVAYMIDRRVLYDAKGMQPSLSLRWKNVTGRQALAAVLKTYNLQYLPDSKMGAGRIVAKGPKSSNLSVELAAKEQLEKLLVESIAAATNDFQGRCAFTSMSVMLVAERSHRIKPVRVVVRTAEIPAAYDVATFFPALTNGYYSWLSSGAEARAAGSNSFRVEFNPPPYVAAADYLKWTESFEDDFDLIREALKRPYAQMDGDYSDPQTVPLPNFICQRWMAQTLADRAKCHLLLGQPALALQDLTLVRDLCRVLEGRPAGNPTTLVATMIDTAITGLYVQTIADGLRLQAWREPELGALQEQLRQIDLPPMLAKSLELERANCCRVVETLKPDQLVNTFSPGAYGNSPQTNVWDKLKNPTYLFLTMGPRGWVYQNMTKIALLDGKLLEGLDPAHRTVSASRTEKATSEMLAELNRFSPYNFLAADAVPNFTRAVQTLARNQNLADEALVACGLERHRLAHGKFPETLAAVTPQYLKKIPAEIINGQPLKYRLKDDGQFVLYSVGWNEKDDGGVPEPLKKDGNSDSKLGDWVWAGSPR